MFWGFVGTGFAPKAVESGLPEEETGLGSGGRWGIPVPGASWDIPYMSAYLTGELTFGSSVPLMGRGDLARMGLLQCK